MEDFRLCGAVAANTAYIAVPGYYLTVGVCPGRIITVENVCSATGAPAFNVIDNGTATGEDVMSREFSTRVHPLTTYKNTTGGSSLPGKDDNKPSGNTMTLKGAHRQILCRSCPALQRSFQNLRQIIITVFIRRAGNDLRPLFVDI